jgi:uncharacterized membrane protein
LSIRRLKMRTWIAAGGALLVAYGAMRLISGIWGEAATYSGTNNTLISGVVLGVGVVLLVVSFFLRGETKEA